MVNYINPAVLKNLTLKIENGNMDDINNNGILAAYLNQVQRANIEFQTSSAAAAAI